MRSDIIEKLVSVGLTEEEIRKKIEEKKKEVEGLLTEEGILSIIASEYGIIDIPDGQVKERGRLQSGEMIGLDLKHGKVLNNGEINDYLKSANPYMKWLNDEMIYLQEHVDRQYEKTCDFEPENLIKRQRYFNVTQEIVEQVIEPMMRDGKEAVGSVAMRIEAQHPSLEQRPPVGKVLGEVVQAQPGALSQQVVHHPLVFLGEEGAGGVQQRSPRGQRPRGLEQQGTLQGDEAVDVLGAPSPLELRMSSQRSQPRAGHVGQHAIEGAKPQGP